MARYPSCMFEGHINRAQVQDQRETPVLRQFRWTDLVAKLAATRDLRDEFERVEAGFNAFGQARREGNEEGKLTVNQAALSDGKAAPLGLGHPANDADQGDRE